MVVDFSFLCLYSDALKMHGIGRKFAVVVALLGLLLPGFSALVETLSAADSPSCCGAAYCPVHHRQARDLQKDKDDCGLMGIPGHTHCSMRACDAASNPMVRASVFVLAGPITLSSPATAGAPPSSARLFSAYVTTVPLTPPPRALPS